MRGVAFFVPSPSCLNGATDVQMSSLLLGKSAEFIFDNANPNRVYLGNPEDLQNRLDATVVRHPDDRFPVLCHQTPPDVTAEACLFPAL